MGMSNSNEDTENIYTLEFIDNIIFELSTRLYELNSLVMRGKSDSSESVKLMLETQLQIEVWQTKKKLLQGA